ncbi:MAG: DUF4369 domain-containing protein [Flavobacteriaceae bacterium]
MKKIFLAITILALTVSCNSNSDHNMIVNGHVKGLKKGHLYLQKVQDSMMVSVDSIFVDGSDEFTLGANVKDAEMYFINLNKDQNFRIAFFGEAGHITVNTELEDFTVKAKIAGSKSQDLLDQYIKMSKRFNDKRLDLIQANFEAQKQGDASKTDSISKQFDNLLKRRYFYTTNFAMTHGDSEVAPYLGMTELFNATNKLLDTVNQSLTPEVKASKYGKAFQQMIDSRK